MDGAPLGPLHGVAITVKDNVAMAGLPMRNGSRMSEGTVPDRDAAVVARVKGRVIEQGAWYYRRYLSQEVLSQEPGRGWADRIALITSPVVCVFVIRPLSITSPAVGLPFG